MKRSTDRILTSHAGSLHRPEDLRQTMAARRDGEPFDEALSAAHQGRPSKKSYGCRPRTASTSSTTASTRSAAGRHTPAAASAALSSARSERVRTPPTAPSRTASRRSSPSSSRRVSPPVPAAASRRVPPPPGATGRLLHRSPDLHRPGGVQARHRLDQGGREGQPVEELVSHRPRPGDHRALDAQPVLQDAGRDALRHRRCHARGVQGDHRRRHHPPARRPRPAGRLPRPLRHEHRGVQASSPTFASRRSTTPSATSRRSWCACTSAGAALHHPHTQDIPLKDIIDIVYKVKAQCYSIEAANPQHEHEWERLQGPPPAGRQDPHARRPRPLRPRIRRAPASWSPSASTRYANLVGKENVIGGTDCGLQRVAHDSIQWAKFRAMREGAAIATKQALGPKLEMPVFMRRHPSLSLQLGGMEESPDSKSVTKQLWGRN